MKKELYSFPAGLLVLALILSILPGGAATPASAMPLRERFRPLSGYLVQVGRQTGVVIDCGGRKGVAVGDLFAVLEPGPPLVHPVTGRPMGSRQRLVSTLKVLRVEPDYAVCRPLNRYLRVPLRRGMVISRFASLAALFIDLNGNGVELFSRVREILPQLNWADYRVGLRFREALHRPGGPGALGYDLYVVYQNAELTFFNGDQELVGAWPAASFSTGAAAGSLPAGSGGGRTGGRYSLSTNDPGKALLTHYRKMAEINLVVKGMDIGDLEGDGIPDIVFTDGEKIYVYQVTPKGLKFRYRYHFDEWGSIVNILVGDVTGDHRDEILVNVFKESEDGFSSFIIGKQQGHYRILARNIHFVMGLLGGKSVADKGVYFVGQGFAGEVLFGSKIYMLKFRDGEVSSGGNFAVPSGFTLPGAVFADINHDGKRELCFINSRNFLEIYQGSKRLWISDERLGGSLSNVQYEVGTEKISYTEKRQINPPMRAVDFDGDGHLELLLTDNESSMSTSFGEYGFLNRGHAKMVVSTGTGFSVKKVTGAMDGPVQGMVFIGNELVCAMVKRGDDLLKVTGTTYLLAFPLPHR